MDQLAHKHLMTLTVEVDFRSMLTIGQTPTGLRRIAPVTGGHFVGKRLNGKILPGADWVVNRPDGVIVIDVRLVLETADGALIYLTYQGRFMATPGAIDRFAKGELLDRSEYSLVVLPRFECGDERHGWLNNVIAVGAGEQTLSGPVYSIFEIN